SQLRDPPIFSGSEVVTAATIPPDGLYVNALSVMSDRSTASLYGPLYVFRWAHSVHNLWVSVRAFLWWIGGGTSAIDDRLVIEKAAVSCAFRVKLLTVVIFSPRSGTSVRSTIMSGPATARSSPSVLVTHGIVRP